MTTTARLLPGVYGRSRCRASTITTYSHEHLTKEGWHVSLLPYYKAVRKLESLIAMWEVNPGGGSLSGHDPDSVFLAAKPGGKYALYFVDGGSAVLDLSGGRSSYSLKWISVDTGQWGKEDSISGGGKVTVSTPGKGGWIAAIVKQ